MPSRTPWILAGLATIAILAIAAVVVVIIVAGSSDKKAATPAVTTTVTQSTTTTVPPTHTMTGTQTIYDPLIDPTSPTACEILGYTDIREGTPVEITDGTGTVVGVSSLGPAVATPGKCVFSWTAEGVPTAPLYNIAIGSVTRGKVGVSLQQLEDDGWSPGLTLGTPPTTTP